MILTTARLLQLRSDARLERDTILEHRVRGGEDPAIAYAETPEVDDFVVIALRDEMLEARGQLAEFGLARYAALAGGPDAAEYQRATDRVEFELMRDIAAAVPELTIAVWRVSNRLDVG